MGGSTPLLGKSTPPLRLRVEESGGKIGAHVPKAQGLKRYGWGPRPCNTKCARQTNTLSRITVKVCRSDERFRISGNSRVIHRFSLTSFWHNTAESNIQKRHTSAI